MKSKVLVNDRIADSIFQQIILRPRRRQRSGHHQPQRRLYLHAAGAQVGGLGIAPGANMAMLSVFEATHGTAPKYADKDLIKSGS